MHIDILSVTIRGGLTAIRGPVAIAVATLRDYIENYPFSMLYICGNHSRVLDHLKGDFDVRRAFTVYQLFSILEEVYQDVVFMEHDPLLFEDVSGGNRDIDKDRSMAHIIENLSLAIKDVSRGRLIIYYSASHDIFFDVVARNSDRVLIFEKEPGGYFIVDSEGYKGCRRLHHRFLPKGQTTLEIF
jgi:hypothetical protein